MTDDYCWLTKWTAIRIWLLMLGVAAGIGLAIKLILSRPNLRLLNFQRPRTTIAVPKMDVDTSYVNQEWFQKWLQQRSRDGWT